MPGRSSIRDILEERDDIVVWDPLHNQKTKVRINSESDSLQISAPDSKGILQWWPISDEDAQTNLDVIENGV